MPNLLRFICRQVVLVWFLNASLASAAPRSHLVIAPHPDDELVLAAGVLYRATQMGERAQVVVLTNGDAFGAKRAKIRNSESAEGLALLNVSENNLFFLGYGDQLLAKIYANHADPDQVILSDAKARETFAYRGRGKMDYHRGLYGQPAPYTRNAFLGDLVDLLRNERPTDIYASIPEDAHPDHSAGTKFLFEALALLKTSLPNYRPVLHLGVIHAPGEDLVWPGEPNRPDLEYTEPAFVKNSPYRWAEIESIPVPADMAIKDPKLNMKSLALSRHASQIKYDDFLFSFVRANEFFWRF